MNVRKAHVTNSVQILLFAIALKIDTMPELDLIDHSPQHPVAVSTTYSKTSFARSLGGSANVRL